MCVCVFGGNRKGRGIELGGGRGELRERERVSIRINFLVEFLAFGAPVSKLTCGIFTEGTKFWELFLYWGGGGGLYG